MVRNYDKIFKKNFKYQFNINFIYVDFINNKDNTIKVFGTESDTSNDYDNYILYTNNELSTKNIDDYFKYILKSEYQIKTITPKINEIWNDKLKHDLTNISYIDLNNFVNKYINILNKYNLDEDVNNARVHGIMIDKIVINTSLKNINALKNYNKKLIVKKED